MQWSKYEREREREKLEMLSLKKIDIFIYLKSIVDNNIIDKVTTHTVDTFSEWKHFFKIYK